MTAFSEPIRHGTHLPHDSLRKKRTTFVASSSMSVPSATTSTAPDPSMLPASSMGPKSRGVSAAAAGRKGALAPPGENAFMAAPSRMPPPYSSTSARTVVPMGTQ
jgi:hypothetical protein